MAFTSETARVAGRKSSKKGLKQKKTLAWEHLGEFFIEEGAMKAMRLLNKYAELAHKEDGSIDFKYAEKYLLHYTNLLEYFKPKQQRVTSHHDNEMVVTVIREYQKG